MQLVHDEGLLQLRHLTVHVGSGEVRGFLELDSMTMTSQAIQGTDVVCLMLRLDGLVMKK